MGKSRRLTATERDVLHGPDRGGWSHADRISPTVRPVPDLALHYQPQESDVRRARRVAQAREKRGRV